MSSPLITSLRNPRVRAVMRLRNARHRRRQQRIVIDGARELCRAIQGGIRLAEVYVCEPLCHSADAQQVLELLPASGGEIIPVSEEVMRKLAFGDRTEGVLGVAEMPLPHLDELPSRFARPEAPLVAVIEGLEKPGNVGAILRSADGAGLSAVIAADPATDLYNPNVIRASLGAVFTVPVCTAAPEAVRHWLCRQGLAIVATRPDATLHYAAVDYRKPTAIVLGSEATGLSPFWSGAEITTVRLPMLGAVDSLNVAATAAVLFYEARRQRG